MTGGGRKENGGTEKDILIGSKRKGEVQSTTWTKFEGICLPVAHGSNGVLHVDFASFVSDASTAM